MPYLVRYMGLEDVDDVGRVDRECFTIPWPLSAYRRELRDNRTSRYVVLTWRDGSVRPEEAASIYQWPETQPEPSSNGNGGLGWAMQQLFRPLGLGSVAAHPERERKDTLVGFAGLWLMVNEAHVTTIGVKESLRGRGLGELLFASMMDLAIEIDARRVTLEVRASNTGAQNLYRKYGLVDEGIRKHYYSDNNEDALIMWSGDLNDLEYRKKLRTNMTQLTARLRGTALTPWYYREHLNQVNSRSNLTP